MLNYQRVLISRTHVKHSGDMLQYLWSGARTCDDEVGKCNRRNHKHNSYNSSEQQQQFSNQEKIEKKQSKQFEFLQKSWWLSFRFSLRDLSTGIAWPVAISYQNRWSRSCAPVELGNMAVVTGFWYAPLSYDVSCGIIWFDMIDYDRLW